MTQHHIFDSTDHRKINMYTAIVTHITATGMCKRVPITAPTKQNVPYLTNETRTVR